VSPSPNTRLRYVIETDAGGDPDDEQSLVRFLLYANEWDVEGIIANRSKAREGENLNPERSGLGIVRALLKAYGQCYTNLVRHDPRYPSPEQLLRRTVAGYADTEEGVNLVIAAVDRDDPRPLWFSNWGTDRGSAPSCLKRALERVLRERGEDGYARFKSRLRLSSDDAFGQHTGALAPPFKLWVDTFRPELDGRRWYHRFSALTAWAGGFDLERDVRTGHGPLGALYPTNTTHWQKEGDSMSFLYLVPTGLNDPEEPGWGSWAGRYGLREDSPAKPYYLANQADQWQGTMHRENSLRRWATHLQNDFRARLDWCVQPVRAANHPPLAVLNGVPGDAILRLHVHSGSELKLDAGASNDPDGDRLHFQWFTYPEAGTYRGRVTLAGTNSAAVQVTIPADAGGSTIHVIVAVTDQGEPPLTRYRRAVLTVGDAAAAWRSLAPCFQPPPAFAGRLGPYRSPLQFDDGTLVKNGADWPRRRAEILKDWHDLMGSWPPVIEKPRIEFLTRSRRDSFTQHRVRLQIAPSQSGEAWLLVPEGRGPFPAALVVFYDPETSIGLGREPGRDFGSQLARRGFVSLCVGTPGGNAWQPELGVARCQPLSFHAYVAANCWHALANLPEVDRARIGVVGHSYGGKWALFAGALWDRFACVVVSDPGIVFDETRPNVNYWEPWYLGFDPAQKRPKAGLPAADNPRTGAYRCMVETGRDLQELHALIAPRPFLVSGGSEDPPERWLALNHALTVNRLLGHTNRVAMTNRKGHPPTEESNEQICAFFEHFLAKGGSEQAVTSGKTGAFRKRL
jgi:dienelactone hydrolase